MEPQQRPSQSNAFKPLPEDDLAHFEALVDRMLRDRAAAGFPARGAPEPLVEAPRITIGHPAGLVEERNAMQQQQKRQMPKEQRVEVLRAFFFKGEVLEVGSKPVLPYYFALEMRSANKAKFVDDEPSPPPPPAATAAQVADRRREPLASVVARPWHVRHARKLIGTGVLAVGAGTAYLAYTNGWRFPAEQVQIAAPAVPEPAAAVERPIAPPPAPVTEAPASATVRTPATAAAGPSAPATARSAAPALSRPPVTHTLPESARVPVGAAAAPAVVGAPQPAAAPSDCPESIAALGLCASRITKAAK